MKTKKHKGAALLASVIIIMSMLFAGSLFMLNWSRKGYEYSVKRTAYSKMFYAAESGIQYAAKKIRGMPPTSVINVKKVCDDFIGLAETAFPDTGYTFTKLTIEEIATDGIVASGANADIYKIEKAYDIRCRVTDNNDPDNYAELSKEIGCFSVSVFDYGVYYQDIEMELYPEYADITIGGKVHSNNGLHLGPFRSLRFLDYITSPEGVYQGATTGKDLGWEDRDGNILISNKKDELVDMRLEDGEFLDSKNPNWKDKSTDKWDDKVRTKEHGAGKIKPAFVNEATGVDSTVLIDPAPDTPESYDIAKYRFENKAGLVITAEGILYEQSGVITNAEFTTRTYIDHITNLNWVVTTNEFFNRRSLGDAIDDPSLGMVYPLDIDIGLFNEWLAVQPESMTFKHHLSDRAGIMYIERENTLGRAVRINNAEVLPKLPNGFTVASVNPVYIRGSYNTKSSIEGASGSEPALIVSDALTVLSDAWDDAENRVKTYEQLTCGEDYDSQVACDTRIIASLISGSAEPTEGEYQATGGVQNFIRFLEYWRGLTLDHVGSSACLWPSRQENKTKNSGNKQIVPRPNRYPSYRNFTYDDELKERQPPGLERFYTFEEICWKKIR